MLKLPCTCKAGLITLNKKSISLTPRPGRSETANSNKRALQSGKSVQGPLNTQANKDTKENSMKRDN